MCGKPVINTNLSTGVPEVSIDNETGITIPVHDIEALSSAIKKLWDDDQLRLFMGMKAKERANKFFSISVFREKFLQTLSSLFD